MDALVGIFLFFPFLSLCFFFLFLFGSHCGVADIGSLDRHRPLLLTQAVHAQHVLASNPLCDPSVIPVQRGKGTRESPRDVIYSCFQGSFKRTFCFSLAKMYQPRPRTPHPPPCSFFCIIPSRRFTMVTDSRSVPDLQEPS